MTEQLKPLTDAETTELLDWVSACQSSYHIDNTPGHRFGGFGSHLQENRDSLVEYVNALIAARAQPAQAVPITSESGKQAAQGASAITSQAVPVLTDEEIDAAYEKARADYQRSRFAVRGQQLTAQDSTDWWFARAIEQAVRAKLGVAVPMTDEQVKDIAQRETWGPDALAMEASLIRAIRRAERHHGIVGKEGA